jgi:predicted nucleic acid-binding Zn ribbon protein
MQPTGRPATAAPGDPPRPQPVRRDPARVDSGPGSRSSRWGRRRAQAVESRRIGDLSLLLPPQRPPASPLAACLASVQQQWRHDGHSAALWQAWPAIAGPQLAPHCRPLHLQGDLLTVGAPPGPWLQALQYNRHQLLGALRGAGFPIRELRFRQYHPVAVPPPGSAVEQEVWALHPSRVDVHGLADCPDCGRPAPVGEMGRWGHCSFCRRQALAEAFLPAAVTTP